MRSALAAVFLASTALAAFAGDVPTPSRVAAVTVYPWERMLPAWPR